MLMLTFVGLYLTRLGAPVSGTQALLVGRSLVADGFAEQEEQEEANNQGGGGELLDQVHARLLKIRVTIAS
jgi:hypothetical protein